MVPRQFAISAPAKREYQVEVAIPTAKPSQL
jgi:hypothetical protein